jgi:hypothetical protein
MGLRKNLICAALAFASSASLTACAPEDEKCEPVAGVYQPIYVARSGNCGPITPKSLPLDGGAGGVKTSTVMEFGYNIVTMVVHKGCSIRVTQSIVTKEGMVESEMNGSDIAVHSSSQLSGQVSYTRFSPTMPQQAVCQGMYEATFTRPDSVVAPTM